MRLSFTDHEIVTKTAVERETKRLATYRTHITAVKDELDAAKPEYSLVHASQSSLHDTLDTLKKQYKEINHLVLVGIGGSSLGVEAVHAVLDTGTVKLTVLDTLASNELAAVTTELKQIKNPKKVAICIISKSGGTTETLVNASVLLDSLKQTWGEKLASQVLFIGDPGTDFMKQGKRMGATCIVMPKIVGGRYSVGTEVGLVPLALLKHDTDSFIEGFLHASDEEIESATAESAARLYTYIQKGHRHYNFFAFEKRLATLGAWYRQLFAESIGKSHDRAGKPVSKGMLPTISTPVELHSIGQLYLSGFTGVYTDFVTFDDETIDQTVAKQGLAKAFSRFSVQEITTALYGGVVGAYHDKKLPFRTAIFEDALAYELGLFMAMRMRETMYVAELMNVDAFDQPNVELYKQRTKAILGLM
jgi:glucose-6-phosphate isomerase